MIGVKGEVHPPLEKNRPSSVVFADSGEHRRKPEVVYGLIERMFPNYNYLELFARGNKRERWTGWGLEYESESH
jgi:N6-adenosine-specific RNA methylase IME4